MNNNNTYKKHLVTEYNNNPYSSYSTYANLYSNQSQLTMPSVNNSSKYSLTQPDDSSINNRYQYKSTYDYTSPTNSSIQLYLDRLHYQKHYYERLKAQQQQYNPYIDLYNSYSNLQHISHERVIQQHNAPHMGNPYNFTGPIYYPLEQPITHQPVILPRIRVGKPSTTNGPNNSTSLANSEIMKVLLALGGNNKKSSKGKGFGDSEDAGQDNRDGEENAKKSPTPNKEEKLDSTEIPMLIREGNGAGINKGIKRDWWKLLRDFINLYIFFSSAIKYSKQAKKIKGIVAERGLSCRKEMEEIKDWLMIIEEPLWTEFRNFKDSNVIFKNIDKPIKIQTESKRIIAVIKVFMENLISKSAKLEYIPERIQLIIYEYIKDKAYFPKKFLTTFQINRLDFNYEGSTRKLNEAQVGMMVAFLIISGVSVQQDLLHIRDMFEEYHNYPNLGISAKYIGSIIHYLTMDAFSNEPKMLKEVIALFNYYRCHHLFNEQVEKQLDIFANNIMFIDKDEYVDFLIDRRQISEFWNANPSFIITYKNFISSWACKLGKLIRLKFAKSDANLVPKPRPIRPADRTYEYDVKIGGNRELG